MGDSESKENEKSDLSEFNKLLWASLIFGLAELDKIDSEESETS